MRYFKNHYFAVFVAILIVTVFLFCGCVQSNTQPQNTPFSSSQAVAPSSPATPQEPVQPVIPFTGEPSAGTSIPVYENTGSSINTEGGKTELKISRAPAVGETAELTFVYNRPYYSPKPITKTWLQFERYEPDVYYPLGKSQNEMDRKINTLAKSDKDSGTYFYLSKAIENQPETKVDEKEVVASGETSWEGEAMKYGGRVELSSQVCFPEEGEWIITAIVGFGDGTHLSLGGNIRLTVGKDSGEFGWPEDYSSHGFVEANPDLPLGICINTTRTPLLDEEMPLDITLYSIEDLEKASFSLNFGKMEGYKSTYPSRGEIIVNSKGTWEGNIKKGLPIQLFYSIKFPEEGDWAISFLTRASPDSREYPMLTITIHIGKDKSWFGWPEDHVHPDLRQPTQEQIEKAARPVSTATPEITTSDEKEEPAAGNEAEDKSFHLEGRIKYKDRDDEWSNAKYCWVNVLDESGTSTLGYGLTELGGCFNIELNETPDYVNLQIETYDSIHHDEEYYIIDVADQLLILHSYQTYNPIYVPIGGDIETIYINDIEINGAFWIKDDLETGFLFGLLKEVFLGSFIAKWQYNWFPDTEYTHAQGEENGYIIIGVNNFLIESVNFQDAVLHEMGHNVMANVFTIDHWPNAGSYPSHHFGQLTDRPFAWVEGWAHFWSAVVTGDEYLNHCSISLESPSTISVSFEAYNDIVEGWVAASLWDLFDGEADGNDNYECNFSAIWNAFDNETNPYPRMFMNFWDNLVDCITPGEIKPAALSLYQSCILYEPLVSLQESLELYPPYDFSIYVDGETKWYGQTDISYDEEDSAQSGSIGDEQSTWMETSVTGPKVISFRWQVSSEEGYDFLSFCDDNDEKYKISGTNGGWKLISYYVPSGTHDLMWKYEKDINRSEGDDCGWVDMVTVDYPLSLSNAVDNSSLSITTSGDSDWFGQKTVYDYNYDAAQSGYIESNQYSLMQTTVDGPGTVSFRWKVRSEENCDILSFWDGNDEKYDISGTDDGWELIEYGLSAGPHTLKWRYKKNNTIDVDNDCGWVDRIVIHPFKLKFITSTQFITAGAASGVITVQAQDGSDNPVNVSIDTIVDLSSTSIDGKFDTSSYGPFDGTITSVSIPSGSNSANFYYKDTTAGNPTITAESTGFSSDSQSETINPGPKTQVTWGIQPPSSVDAGDTWNSFTAIIADQYGNRTDETDTVTISPSSGSLYGTLSKAAVAGMATFNDIYCTQSGSISLTATSGSLDPAPSSNPVHTNPATANTLVFSTQPASTGTVDNIFTTQPVVQIQDQYGNLKTSATSSVTLSGVLASDHNTSGAGTITGTNTKAAVGGIVTFTGVGYSKLDTIHVKATSGSLTPDVSTTDITLTTGIKNKLVWDTQPPSSAVAGTTWNSFSVNITDQYGNQTSDTDTVTISPSTGTLEGTTGKAAVSGVATFDNISCNLAGDITITATSGALTASPPSNHVTINAGTKNKLMWGIQPPASVIAGYTWNSFSVIITDQYGNQTTATDTVTIIPSSGSLDGTISKAAVGGIATFDDIYRTQSGNITLTAASGELTATPASNSITINPNPWHSPSNYSVLSGTPYTDPENAFSDENSYAWLSYSGVNHQIFYDYGINIPDGSTIEGIEVRLDWWLDQTAYTNYIDVGLSCDGGATWISSYRTAATERTSDGNPTDTVGGPTDTWDRTWSASDLSDANFRVKLHCYSGYSGRDFYLDWLPVRVYYTSDTTPPSVTIDQASGQDDPTSDSPVNFTVVFSEVVTGFETRDVIISGTAGATEGEVSGSGTTYNVAVSDMTSSGTVTATIPAGAAHDAAGNPSLASTSTDNSVTYQPADTTPPAGSLNINSGAAYTGSSPVMLNLQAADATGVTRYRIDNGTDASNGTIVPVTSTTNFADDVSWSISGDGSKTVSVQYGDAAGNWSQNYTDSIILDTAPPAGSLDINSGAAYTCSSPVTLNLQAADAVGVTRYRIDNGTDASNGAIVPVTGATSFAADVSWTVETGDGTKTVSVQYGDAAGNWSQNYTDSISLDTVPPDGSLNINSGAAYAGSTAVTLNLQAADEAGVTGYRAANGSDASGASTTYITSTTSYSDDIAWTLESEDGVKTVAVQYRDAAGNWSPNYTDCITLDTTPPTVTVNQAAGQADPTSTSPVNFTVIFSEPVFDFDDGTDVTVHGISGAAPAEITGEGTTYNVAVSGMISSGTLTVIIPSGVAHDAAFHDNVVSTSTDNSVVYYLTDIAPPEGSLNIDSGAYYTGSTAVTLNLQATDEVGVTGYRAANGSDASGASATYITGTASFIADIAWPLEPGDGIKTVAVQYRDEAGNWSINYTHNITLDATPPEVSIDQASGQADPTSDSPINFTVIFSEPVYDFATGDVTIGGTAGGTKTHVVTGSGTTYNVAVSDMTLGGTVTAAIPAGAAHDAAGNASTASTSTDNSVTYELVWYSPSSNAVYTGTGFEIDPENAYADDSSYATDLYNNSDQHLYYEYGINVPDGSTIEGIEVRLDWWLDSTAGTNGTLVYLSFNGGTSWTSSKNAITKLTADGNPTDIVGGPTYTWGHTWSISELSDANFRVKLRNYSSVTGQVFYLDWVPVKVYYSSDAVSPSVTIDQAAGQADPTSDSPVNFTVVFSEPVADFSDEDVIIGGTAGGTKTCTVTGEGTTYNVAVSDMTCGGSVTAEIPAGAAHDGDGNASTASTSTDNSVTYHYSSGWLNPSAGAADPEAAGDGYELYPSYAYTNDSQYAQNNDGPGDRHIFYNYGINIPEGGTIDGIEVRLDWWMPHTGGINSMDVELSCDGGNTWISSYRTAATERTSDGNPTDTVGGPSDTWDRSWTISDLSDANFRVRLTCNATYSTQDFRLDWAPVKVYYTPPAGPVVIINVTCD
ncbi:MAG: hypothetical protein JXA46_17415 [Dehalococcoidales bacterium]|nr:hypothetical protein [Dehalococcoidales bacterium]